VKKYAASSYPQLGDLPKPNITLPWLVEQKAVDLYRNFYTVRAGDSLLPAKKSSARTTTSMGG